MDYIDPDIMKKLEALEKAEELREKQGVYDSGNFKLTDFGQAYDIDNTNTKSRGRGEKGTTFWKAPEQLEDDFLFDKSTDVYSLGVLFPSKLLS